MVICMKNILIFICSLMAFGCDFAYNQVSDFIFLDKAYGHKLYCSEKFDSLKTIDEILLYSSAFNFPYLLETEDHWKNPEETINDDGGDCEDFCILFLNICKIKFGIEGRLLLINRNRSIIEGGKISHAIVLLSGKYYDPTCNFCIDDIETYLNTIGYSYSFDEIFTQ